MCGEGGFSVLRHQRIGRFLPVEKNGYCIERNPLRLKKALSLQAAHAFDLFAKPQKLGRRASGLSVERFKRLLKGLGSAAGSLIGFAPCVDRLDAHADFSAQVAQSFPLPDVVVKELRGRHGAGNRTHDAEKAPANVHQNLR